MVSLPAGRVQSARRSRRRTSCGGLPYEPVWVSEGCGVAADHDPMRPAAVGGDIRVLGKSSPLVQPQLDGTGCGFELCVAAISLGHGEAAVDVKAPALLEVRDSEQEHDPVDLP